MKKYGNKFGLTILSLVPALALADDFNYKLTEKSASGDINSFVTDVRNWIVGTAGILAVIFIVLGGFQLITSSGNPKRAETAKKTLTYAIFGLLAVILAGVVLTVITSALGDVFKSKVTI